LTLQISLVDVSKSAAAATEEDRMNARKPILAFVLFVLATIGSIAATPALANCGTHSPGGGCSKTSDTSDASVRLPETPDSDEGFFERLLAELSILLGI
jgi:hypothetical protein